MYRVLIADPDGASRDLLAQALSVGGCRVEVVSSGEEALRRISEQGTDVLITEVHLPDMPAWTLIPQVHRLDPDLPVIAVTSDDTWETSRKVRVKGGPVSFYGLKPLNLQEMQQVVRHVAEWRQRRKAGFPPAVGR